ncbi:MAG TPA: DUF6165 family protein [Rhizomicrobium sp.]|jgi:hypothetical protein|nr:DUF6165 family protein [Rhizomicrobium sp.]
MTLARAATPRIPVSWGELIDKISILEIKRERIAAKGAVANVEKELGLLRKIADPVLGSREIAELKSRLGGINRELWDVENVLRDREAKGDFGAAFVDLARSVYKKNDERLALKTKINLLLKSEFVEEKSYTTTSSGLRE